MQGLTHFHFKIHVLGMSSLLFALSVMQDLCNAGYPHAAKPKPRHNSPGIKGIFRLWGERERERGRSGKVKAIQVVTAARELLRAP